MLRQTYLNAQMQKQEFGVYINLEVIWGPLKSLAVVPRAELGPSPHPPLSKSGEQQNDQNSVNLIFPNAADSVYHSVQFLPSS